MARLSPVNMPGANWSDLGTDYDPLAIEQGFQKIRANEIELQHAEETIRQQNALKAAEVRERTSRADALAEETRQKKALFEAGLSSAKVDSGILADMNLDDLPPDLAREASELRKLVDGAKGEADWLMLGGRISSLRQRIGQTNASSNLADMIGRTQALGQQLGLSDSDDMLEAITALEHNRFTSQQPIDPITGKATTGRAKGGMTIPEAQAAIAQELQHRETRLRNIEMRQMYSTNTESMIADINLLVAKGVDPTGKVKPEAQAIIDQFWEQANGITAKGGFNAGSQMDISEMGRRHRELTLSWQAALAVVDGQDAEKSLAEQLGVKLIGEKRRQQEWDSMRRRMRYLSIAQMLPGNSQFKDGAMALLSPDNGDLYTAAWDDSAAWQATILPMEEKLDRFIASQPPGMDDITAIQLLHQKEAEYNDMAEAHGAALDKRGGIATALSEWSVMKAWQETMPNASHEQYDSAWAPGLEPFVMLNDLDGLSRTKRERLREAFEAAGLDQMFAVTSYSAPNLPAGGYGQTQSQIAAQQQKTVRPAELEDVLTGSDSKSTFPVINMLRRVEQQDPRKVAIFLNYLAVNKHPDQSDSEIARDDLVEKRPVNPRIASARDARRIARDLRVEEAFIDPSVVDELEAELAVTDPRDYPRDPKKDEDVVREAEADAHVAGRGSGPMSTHQRTIAFLRKFNTPEGDMGDAPSKVEIRRTLSQLDNAARKATGEERKRIMATFKEMQQIAVNYGVTYNRRR